MSILRLFLRTWYCIVAILLACAKVLIVLAIIAAVLPLAFVLSAQLSRWWRAGEWRSVPLGEFLEMLAIAPAADSFGTAAPALEWLLWLPATLVLLLIALAMFLLKRQLDKAGRRLQRNWLSVRQRAVTASIDDALAGTRTGTPGGYS